MPIPPDLATSPTVPKARGVLFHAAAHLTDDEAALAVAWRVAARRLPNGWEVRPLAAGGREYLALPPAHVLPVSRAWDLARRLEHDRDVLDAEPDLVVPGLEPAPGTEALLLTPRERRAKSSGPGRPRPCAADCAWSLTLARVPDAWALRPPRGGRARGAGIRIWHPDTGYTRHPEIWSADRRRSRVLAELGRDYVDEDGEAIDPLARGNPGHGTGTASVIVSGTDNEDVPFVHGVAPRAHIVPLRVTPSVVLFSFSRLAQALHDAAAGGAHIVSISLGGVTPSAALERAVARAMEAGAIVLAAGGNIWPWVVYPARLPGVIAVAACTCERKPWRGSARGAAVAVAAPGESVWRAQPVSAEDEPPVAPGSGTSFAVATTAGVCALWLAYHDRDRLVRRYGGARHLAPVFREVLVEHGTDTPPGWKRREFGSGIVDARRVLEAALPDTPPAIRKGPTLPRGAAVVEELVAMLPAADPDAVRARLSALLRADPPTLPSALDRYGHELLFHASTNPEVRAALAAEPVRAGRADAKVARARVQASPRFRTRASRGLARRVAAGR